MSHEGIRIVSEEQARQEAQAEAKLAPEAITPVKVRVHKTEGTGMEIDWKDGHRSAWTFAFLRWACPCAICNEEREKTGRPLGTPKQKDSGPFALYEAPPRPAEVTPIGRYALKFKWNDGHESGIYSWDYLRRISL